MELAGSLAQNLDAAVKSAARLRGHPAHEDTLAHWQKLLAHARAAVRSESVDDLSIIEGLMSQLQSDLAERERV